MTLMFPERVVKRVMTKWHQEGECWISDYSTGSHGYAQIVWLDKEKGKSVGTTAHRVAWWAANRQEIGSGMTVDHICRRRPCVNPSHLRLLSNEANASDNGMSQYRTNEELDRVCHKGHPLVLGGNGKTYCRTCVAANKRRRRAAANAMT